MSSKDIQYLALLRGINVGGNNIIKMIDLKACFESMDFDDVLTYIQSGNVLFKSDELDIVKLTTKVELGLSKRFSYQSKVVIVSQSQLEFVVKNAPSGFGQSPDEYRYDVMFIKEPLTVDEAFKNIKIKEGVDNAFMGSDVLYTSKLISRATQSHLTKLISMPMYQNMTIRNWNTTTKLLELMNK